MIHVYLVLLLICNADISLLGLMCVSKKSFFHSSEAKLNIKRWDDVVYFSTDYQYNKQRPRPPTYMSLIQYKINSVFSNSHSKTSFYEETTPYVLLTDLILMHQDSFIDYW